MTHLGIAELVFFLTLAATFAAAIIARQHSAKLSDKALSNQQLNKWLVGLSAATTGNSGFIVTAGVGLGYLYGLQWIFLPVGWLIGDLIFWRYFPQRINAVGRKAGATTPIQLLTHGLRNSKLLAALCTLAILLCLSGYTAAQWLAGQKFLAGAFMFPPTIALGLFALIIIAYSSIGGFRGSVYVDVVQAVIRLLGSALAIGGVAWFAYVDPATFNANLTAAGPEFFQLFPDTALLPALGFVIGFAVAAIGFGLGQPQIMTRYLAGSSPQETRAAWWIYIGFLQITWLSMQLFGLLLRGVMPGIADPEMGLSLFFTTHFPAIVVGIIIADIFATIAGTSNGLLVAMAQAFKHDLLPLLTSKKITLPMPLLTLIIGVLTMVISLYLPGNVYSMAIGSISILGAGLGSAIMIKVMGWKHTSNSLLVTILAGVAIAIWWKMNAAFGTQLNEVAPGMGVALLVNVLFVRGFKS